MKRLLVHSLLVLALSFLADNGVAEEVQFYPKSQARMFASSPKETYDALHETLEELGLRPGRRDPKTGRIQSRRIHCGEKGKLGLELEPPPGRTEGQSYSCKRLIVYTYVSPFVEPARVHISSRIEFEADRAPSMAVRDHDETLGNFVLDALENKLGTKGYPTPIDYAARHELARRLVRSRGDELPTCLAREAEMSSPLAVERPEEKKNFRGYTPRGVWATCSFVTRETVDSCMSMCSATSRRVRGRRCWIPFSKNSRCRSTMKFMTFSMV